MLIHFARPALITRPLPRLLVTVRRLRLGWALMLLSVLAALAGAEPSDPLRYRGGLRNSADRYQLSAKQLSAVAASLREKTGFLDLRFDQDGFLTLGDRAHVGAGSAVARALLLAAVNSVDSFELESHNHSSDVVFAFLGESVIYESRVIGARIEVHPIKLDFSDFAYLKGDKEVLAAFDLGFAVLHELAHAVLHLHDAKGEPFGLGECENYINRIRRELGLPERQNYFARVHQAVSAPGRLSTKVVELNFAREVRRQGQIKTEPCHLTWDAQFVGHGPPTTGPRPQTKDRPPAIAWH